MGLININGSNPFAGQSDPYLSMDSSLSYENGRAEVKNTYQLNGVLTGCDKQSLMNAQNSLVNKFDWEKDPTIPSNITINGVVSSSQQSQLIPTSLSFENSKYIGGIQYTLSLELFTGRNVESDDERLINKTHTETTNIDEKGCASISTNISCTPNANLTGCGALEAANAWISGQLGVTKLGEITREKDMPLQNESITIDPLTSSISYSSSHAQKCNDLTEGATPSGFQLAFCSEEQAKDANCPSGIVTKTYNGEVYKSGALEEDLLFYLNENLIDSFAKINNFSANYDNGSDSIKFSFSVLYQDGEEAYEPEDLIVNDYTKTTNINHDDSSQTISVGGSFFILNRSKLDKDTVINKTDQEILSEAKSIAGTNMQLQNSNITRNVQDGTLNYSTNFSNGNNSDIPNLDGVSGLQSYSISCTPPIRQYELIRNLNCDDLILDKEFAQLGNMSINLTTVSGSGYDFQENAKDHMKFLQRSLVPNVPDIRVEDDSAELSDDGASYVLNYAIKYKSNAVTDKSNISKLI